MEANKFKQIVSATVKITSTPTIGDLFPSLKWVAYASGYKAQTKKLKGYWDTFFQTILDMKKSNTNMRNNKLSNADFVDVLLEQPSENGSGHLEDDCIQVVIQVVNAMHSHIHHQIRHNSCVT